MATTAVPTVSNDTSGLDSLIKLLGVLAPSFGTGKQVTSTGGGTSTSTETASVSPEANDQSNALLKQIMDSANGGDIDAMVQNILTQAKNTFGQQAIEGNASGVRAYSDTVQTSLRNDAMAKATAAAAQAKLSAINDANKTATQLVDAKLANTRSVTQVATKPPTTSTQQTGASSLGKTVSLLSGAAAVRSLIGGKKAAKPEAQDPEQLSGPIGPDSQQMTDQSFSAPADSGTLDADALFRGEDINSAVADGRSAVAAANNPVVDPELAQDQNSPIADQQPIFDVNQVVAPDTASTAQIITDQGLPVGGAMPAARLPIPGTQGTQVYPMPPAGAGTAMPPAIRDPGLEPDIGGGGDEAVDVIPSDLSASINFGGSDFVGDLPLATDAGAELATDAAFEATPIGPIFTLVNIATDGQLGKSVTNLPVVGGPITDIGSGITDIAGEADDGITAAEDAAGTLISAPLDFADSVADNVSNACYITTAATHGGELDQGFTLTVLRNFRDEYMQDDPERKAELLEYYAVAPEIVKAISKRSDSERVWGKIRSDYLAPAVVSYLCGELQETHKIYSNMMKFASQQGVH